MRDIYLNPYKYACVCNIPFELAKIACLKRRHYYKELRKHGPFCPACGSKSIFYEEGSYEDGYDSYVECENCEETFGPHEIENINYIIPFNDFDTVLYFAETRDVVYTEKEWQEFARKEILGR